MAVSFVDSASAALRADGDTTGITVTHGFTLQDGDVLYAMCSRSDDLGSPWGLTGWTEIGVTQATTTGNDMLSSMLRKVISSAAGEPSSYTFLTAAGAGTNQQTAVVVQLRGADTSTPEETVAGSGSGSNDFTPDAGPSMTVSTAGGLALVAHCASMNDGVTGHTGGAPSGYTLAEAAESTLAGQLGSWTEVAYKAGLSAGSEDPGVWTGTPDDATSEWHAFAIIVKPAAAAAAKPKTLLTLGVG